MSSPKWQIFRLLIIFFSLSLFSACRNHQPVVILFDNDVHCAMDGYAAMADLKAQSLATTPNVAVVSAGDFVQGDAIGTLTSGESVIRVMNAVGYDFVTIGNHEFDYTIPQQLHLMDMLSAKVLCCNFTDLHTHRLVYAPYAIERYGDRKIAFIGVATPATIASSVPQFFTDEEGNMRYTFHTDDVFGLVQQAALEARKKGADYVIVLSHLGDDTEVDSSLDLCRSTFGIDAVLDGHAHHVLCQKEQNAQGDSILLLSTGTKFQFIGRLTIDDEGLRPELLPCPQEESGEGKVWSVLQEERDRLRDQLEKVVGYSLITLSDKDANGQRAVRRQETALGHFAADAFRWCTSAEIGVIHGGGLRASVLPGDIRMKDIIALMPFNNRLAKVSMTGQQILDAFEVAVREYPNESGDWHVASGLRFEFDPSVPSSVQLDEQGLFLSLGATRRIVRMEVQEADGTWHPIDPARTYTIGGLDYTLINRGSSGMFLHATPLETEPLRDTDVLIRYIHHLGDTIR